MGAEAVDVFASMTDRSVDHVICDPPYSAAVHNGIRAAIRNEMPDVSQGNCRRRRLVDFGFAHLTAHDRQIYARAFARLARRWVLVFSDIESSHLWRLSLVAAGLQYVRTALWVRAGGAPQFSGDRPAVGAEAITIAHHAGRKAWNGGGKAGVYDVPIVANRAGERGSRLHTTQKPEALMLALVSDFTDPDDLILDPFAGSGTTGVAALRLGRRAILIEKDPKYAALCCERMSAEEQQHSLQAHRAGQLTLLGD